MGRLDWLRFRIHFRWSGDASVIPLVQSVCDNIPNAQFAPQTTDLLQADKIHFNLTEIPIMARIEFPLFRFEVVGYAEPTAHKFIRITKAITNVLRW